MGLLSVNGLLVAITDKMGKNSSLAVDLSEILAKIGWAVLLLEKNSFYSLEIKKAGQRQSQLDCLCSAFRLIQEENGPF